MPKIAALPWRKLARVFELDGWKLDRKRGDHLVYVKDGAPRPVIIPKYREVEVFIVLNNLKTAHMPRERYLELLKRA